MSSRADVATLIVCALLGLETVPNLLFGVSFFSTAGYPSLLLGAFVGLVGGLWLGSVLLSQGGISVPSRQERGAIRGALVGSAVGVLPVLLLSTPALAVLGFCALVGLAVGRAFDRPPIHPTS